MQVRHKMLEQLLQKSDALDEKLTMIEDDLNMQITHIKANFKSHKLQSKHEIDNIKNTLDDVKKKQRLNLTKVWRTKHQNQETNARQEEIVPGKFRTKQQN